MRISIVAASMVVSMAGLAASGAAKSGVKHAGSGAPAVCCDEPPHHDWANVKPMLTLAGANRAISAAVAEAARKHAGGAIAVVDDGGNLIAFQRLDGTFAAGAEVSTGKARTSALFKKPTKSFEDAINGGRVALTAVHAITPLQGGVPIMVDGQVVGAIGVSGAHSQMEDEEIAIAGAAALLDQPTSHEE